MDTDFEHDLNVWVTSFLTYGSWGNHGDYIQSMLYAVADRAHGRQGGNAEQAREHIHHVLLRAGKTHEEAREVSDEVYDIVHHVQTFLAFGDRGAEYLDHREDMDIDPACDPANDRRFSKAPRHLTFGDHFQVWVCATDAELETIGVAVPDRSPSGTCRWFHRTDGPAWRMYSRNGYLMEEIWYQNGRQHRDGGEPSYTWYGANGVAEQQRWYTNGVKTREIGHPKLGRD